MGWVPPPPPPESAGPKAQAAYWAALVRALGYDPARERPSRLRLLSLALTAPWRRL